VVRSEREEAYLFQLALHPLELVAHALLLYFVLKVELGDAVREFLAEVLQVGVQRVVANALFELGWEDRKPVDVGEDLAGRREVAGANDGWQWDARWRGRGKGEDEDEHGLAVLVSLEKLGGAGRGCPVENPLRGCPKQVRVKAFVGIHGEKKWVVVRRQVHGRGKSGRQAAAQVAYSLVVAPAGAVTLPLRLGRVGAGAPAERQHLRHSPGKK
jgi:hypothetical protein